MKPGLLTGSLSGHVGLTRCSAPGPTHRLAQGLLSRCSGKRPVMSRGEGEACSQPQGHGRGPPGLRASTCPPFGRSPRRETARRSCPSERPWLLRLARPAFAIHPLRSLLLSPSARASLVSPAAPHGGPFGKPGQASREASAHLSTSGLRVCAVKACCLPVPFFL